jgi:hypothetical protein
MDQEESSAPSQEVGEETNALDYFEKLAKE